MRQAATDGGIDVGGRHRRRPGSRDAGHQACAASRSSTSQAPSTPRRGEGPQFAGAFPARHVIEMELHEFLGHGQGFRLVAQLEDGIAADHFLGLDEGAVDDAELAVGDPHPRAGRSGISPPLSIIRPALISRSESLLHGLHQRRGRARHRLAGR